MTFDRGCFYASAVLFLVALVQHIWPAANIPLVSGNVALVALVATAIGLLPNLTKMSQG